MTGHDLSADDVASFCLKSSMTTSNQQYQEAVVVLIFGSAKSDGSTFFVYLELVGNAFLSDEMRWVTLWLS